MSISVPAVDTAPDALHMAIARDDLPTTRALLRSGAIPLERKINTLYDRPCPYPYMIDYTPLHVAARWCRIEATILLLAHGADVNARDARMSTPLHHAACCVHAEIVAILLANGATVDALNIEGDLATPLHYAIRQEPSPSMDGRILATTLALLTAGASVAAVSDANNTVFHYIAMKGPYPAALLRMLHHFVISSGVTLNISNQQGKTPMQLFITRPNRGWRCMNDPSEQEIFRSLFGPPRHRAPRYPFCKAPRRSICTVL